MIYFLSGFALGIVLTVIVIWFIFLNGRPFNTQKDV